MEQNRCAVLVPVNHQIEPACEAGLIELERRGYAVRRVRGFAAIDQGRNQIATDAFNDGFESTMWIDSDIGFNPNDVDRLRLLNLPIVCGIYPKKGSRALAIHVLPGQESITFGESGGLIEIMYAAAGFLFVHRNVYETMVTQLELPICNQRFRHPTIPFFLPMVLPDGTGHWYLAEDYAFCERARQCGFSIIADTRIRLSHIGSYGFSWEDGGSDVQRFATYKYFLS